jgi:hypothetical protein
MLVILSNQIVVDGGKNMMSLTERRTFMAIVLNS